MMFHKPSVRLATLYLAIVMAISLFFSGLIYQLSIQELERGLRRPDPVLMRPSSYGLPIEIRNQILDEREDQFNTARERILMRLVAINLLVLVSGGFLSYYLAIRTLRPIEEAHEAQSRFTADASHELRTPITAMRSENEVALMDPKLTLKQAKLQLQSNIEELEKLTQLSEGLLRLAQLDFKSLPREDLSVTELVAQAVNRSAQAAENKKILISTNISPDIIVEGDATSLTESLSILIDNAIKYSPEKSEINVAANKRQKQVEISFIDRGIGIGANELPHIFERFYRADSSRTNQEITGYGLGLAIAQNIIQVHDGDIHVSSAPGKGSTFTVLLPIKN